MGALPPAWMLACSYHGCEHAESMEPSASAYFQTGCRLSIGLLCKNQLPGFEPDHTLARQHCAWTFPRKHDASIFFFLMNQHLGPSASCHPLSHGSRAGCMCPAAEDAFKPSPLDLFQSLLWSGLSETTEVEIDVQKADCPERRLENGLRYQ